MLETILEYFVGICDDIACFLSPKHRAAREREARNDPFNQMLSLIFREIQLMNVETELWQLERAKELQKQIEKFERGQEISQKRDQEKILKWERTLQEINENEEEIIKIKELIIREIEQKKKKDFFENRRFSWPH